MPRLLRRWFVFFVVVYRNRIQIFGLKYLAAVEATDIFCAVAPVQEFGPLMLASLHNEVKTYSRLHDMSVKCQACNAISVTCNGYNHRKCTIRPSAQSVRTQIRFVPCAPVR